MLLLFLRLFVELDFVIVLEYTAVVVLTGKSTKGIALVASARVLALIKVERREPSLWRTLRWFVMRGFLEVEVREGGRMERVKTEWRARQWDWAVLRL